jgi:hypothetical protein
MIERRFSLPEIIGFAGTRVALGTGIGMLIAGGLDRDARKAVGLALTVVGAFTTVPFIFAMIEKKNATRDFRAA